MGYLYLLIAIIVCKILYFRISIMLRLFSATVFIIFFVIQIRKRNEKVREIEIYWLNATHHYC